MKQIALLICLAMSGGVAGARQLDGTLPKPDTQPVVLKMVDAEFSEEARHKKISGTVEVSVRVGVDGKVTKARVVRGVGYGLDEQAITAVKKYRFRPATKDGQPVECDLYVDVNFKILK